MVDQIYNNPELETYDLIGYIALFLLHSLIFFAIRHYKIKILDNRINFWEAFKVGILITTISSTIYVIVWLFYYYLFVPDFFEVYSEFVLNNCSPDDFENKKIELDNFGEMYKNPLLVVLLTYFEVFPIGLLITLISSFILKSKNRK